MADPAQESAYPDLVAALKSAASVMATSPRDWARSNDEAWLWGLFCGWDDEDPGDEPLDAMSQVAARHGWSAESVARLRRLRAAVKEAAGG